MPVLEQELAELESKLAETFAQEDWSVPIEGSVDLTPRSGQIHEINMDLTTLGGSRPRTLTFA